LIQDDWDWKDQKELVSTESDNSRMTENWLDSFLISISPCGNLIVVASETRIVLCIGKWSINNEAVFSASHRFDFKRDTSKEESALFFFSIYLKKLLIIEFDHLMFSY